MPNGSYPHEEIEKRAREKWEALGLHTTDLTDSAKEPYYLLAEFPYPSGDLHIGHWYAFAVTDIFARYKRLTGKNVLFPIGFDAFGLPAENAAIKHGKDPEAWTLANIERMREQLRSMGASFDWSKEVVTCSPEYYRWTQWLFTKLYEKDLAYRAEASVKWCPKDQTVLANEQVIDGTCERCGSVVEEKRLTQWFLRITGYAERLLKDLEPLPWREEIKEAQRAWIGKSEGARLTFPLSTGQSVEVFTTRPDTVFGATYLVLAPEHRVVTDYVAQPTLEEHFNGAGILIIDDDGNYRLQERDEHAPINPDRITPFGGHRDGDESDVENAMRELKEELELEASEAELVRIGTFEGYKDVRSRMFKYRLPKDAQPVLHEGRSIVTLSFAEVLSDPRVTDFTKKVVSVDAVREYIEQTKRKTERERSENKEKTGVRLVGVTAKNLATGEDIPVYVADYVLGSYGTGAVMAVPAHDERDFEFAKIYDLPMRQVVVPCGNDTQNPPQEGLKEVKRDTVVVHLRDLSTGKFALLNWHGTLEGITTAIMGGIEEGQTPEAAALAEIREEAALEGARIVHKSPWITAARYCASHKNENRCAHSYVLLAEVDGLSDQGAIDPSELAKHTLVWVDEDKVLSRLTPEHQKQMWQLLHEEKALTSDGYLINSGKFDGRDSEEIKWEIVEAVGGIRETQFRMRDWLVSRQRYWGCPIPIVYDPEGKPNLVPSEHLPWLLPKDVDFTPSASASPLASSKDLRDRVTRIFGEGWTPEFDTLDTFVDSSWYFTRYLDSGNDLAFSDPETMRSWLPVHRYSGGSEHTTMHLLYARFFYKALYDLGLVSTKEPFNERFNRGLIMGTDGQKMSKRWENVINPDDVVESHGTDAVRLYLAFIGPYNEPGHYPWKPEGLTATRRFLDRVHALREKVSDTEQTETEKRALAKAAEKIATDLERFKTNTAVSALMILMNALEEEKTLSKASYRTLLILLAPFAPHLAEHLYESVIGETGSVHQEPWPTFDTALLESETVAIGVQIGGKTRGEIVIPATASEEEAVAAALLLPRVKELLPNGSPSRVIYRAGRILNLVP